VVDCWLIYVSSMNACSNYCGECKITLGNIYKIKKGDFVIFYTRDLRGNRVACCAACVDNVTYTQWLGIPTDTNLYLSSCTWLNTVLPNINPAPSGVTPLGPALNCLSNLGISGISPAGYPCLQYTISSSSETRSLICDSSPADCELCVEQYFVNNGFQVVRIPNGYQAGFDMIAWKPGHNKNEIHLIEVKVGSSGLTQTQQYIRQMVLNNTCAVRNYLCGPNGIIRGICQQYNILTACPYKAHFRVFRCFDGQVVEDKKLYAYGVCSKCSGYI